MLSTGITLNADQWDDDRQCVCNHPRRLTLQRMIDRLKLKAEDAALDLAAAGLLPTMTATELRDQIKAVVNGEEYRPPVVTLLARFAVYAESKTNARTRDIYLNTARMIERTTGDIALDSINRQWLAALDASLTRAGIATNTRAIHFRNIRAVMNDAIDNDLTTNYPFRRFIIRHEQTAHRVLSVTELRHSRHIFLGSRAPVAVIFLLGERVYLILYVRVGVVVDIIEELIKLLTHKLPQPVVCHRLVHQRGEYVGLARVVARNDIYLAGLKVVPSLSACLASGELLPVGQHHDVIKPEFPRCFCRR